MLETIPVSTAAARRTPTPLAACLASALCLGAPASAAAATTWTVNTCAEDNVGSGTTAAQYEVPDPGTVRLLLRSLLQRGAHADGARG